MNIKTPQDEQTLKQLAQDGDAEAMYQLAEFYAAKHATKKSLFIKSASVFWLAAAAKAGHKAATFKMNRHDRLKQLANDAEQGDSDAQLDLGMHHYKGMGGLPVCLTTAAKWLLEATKQNHADAFFWLSKLYASSDSVELRQQATAMCSGAAQLGHVEAQWQLSGLYAQDENDELAAHWMEKAAQNGHMQAQLELAESYRHGMYRYRADLEQAVIWYTKAAVQGSDHAKMVLQTIETGVKA